MSDDNIKYFQPKKIGDVVATKIIKEGDEIFVSYGESYFKGKNKITINNE
jgi:hypothetical protein